MSTMLGALRRLVRSERGLTVPMTLMVIIVGLGLGGAAVTASIYAQRGSTRDQAVKEALAAADAGAELAIYRLNKVVTNDAQPCVVVGSGESLQPGSAGGDGWCPQITGSVEGKSFTYKVSPWTRQAAVRGNGTRRVLTIVSSGTSDNVSRRIAITASAREGSAALGDAAAIGVDEVRIAGESDVGSTDNPTNTGSNADVILDNNGTLCGDGQYGVGHDLIFLNNGTQCSGYSSAELDLALAPIDPGNVWTQNDNGRICATPQQDIATPRSACTRANGGFWNPTTRTLTMGGSDTLTLGGTNYSFCKLDMQGNSQLIVAQGAVANIFFGSPEQCGMTPSSGCDGNAATVDQICLSGNPRITTTSQNPADLRLLIIGSDSVPTAVGLAGVSRVTNEFALYAPRTDVYIHGNAQYVGAVAGKTLLTDGSAQLLADPRALIAGFSVAIIFKRDRYVECTGGTMTSPPDSSC